MDERPLRPADRLSLVAPLVAAALALATAFLLPGCGEAEEPGRRGPHVVLVVVDTLRADHLTAFGHDRDTHPALADFVARATRFERCSTPSPWTTPGTASILSGLHPLRHGSTTHGTALGDGVASLAEVLRDGGWRTAGFSHNPNVSAAARFDQGFERFEDFDGSSTEAPDIAEMNAAAVAWVDEELGDDRAFLYLQPMNVHGPYRVPEGRRDDLLGRPPAPGFTYYGTTMKRILKRGELARRERVRAPMLRSLGEQYDPAIRYTTDELGALFEDLDARGLYDDALVVLTADHGEELFEHGGFSHGYSLHEELLHVPLLVKLPGQRRGGVVRAPVSVQDVYPTVLEALGLEAPYAGDGRSLLPRMRAAAEADGDGEAGGPGGARRVGRRGPPVALADDRVFLYHVDWPGRCVGRALRLGRWKLVEVREDYEGRRDVVELYDLEADPGETRDLAARRPGVVARLQDRLRRELAARVADGLAPPENVLHALDLQALEALGYLGR